MKIPQVLGKYCLWQTKLWALTGILTNLQAPRSLGLSFSCLSNFNFHDRNNHNPRCRQKFQPECVNFGLFYTCVFERQKWRKRSATEEKITDLDWHPDKCAGSKNLGLFFSCLSNFNFHDRDNRNPRCWQKFQPECVNFGLFYTCVFERQKWRKCSATDKIKTSSLFKSSKWLWTH